MKSSLVKEVDNSKRKYCVFSTRNTFGNFIIELRKMTKTLDASLSIFGIRIFKKFGVLVLEIVDELVGE